MHMENSPGYITCLFIKQVLKLRILKSYNGRRQEQLRKTKLHFMKSAGGLITFSKGNVRAFGDSFQCPPDRKPEEHTCI